MVHYIPRKKLCQEGDKEGVLLEKIIDQTESLNITECLNNFQSRELTPEEALALSMDAGLSKNSYETIRNMAIKCGHDLFPPYLQVNSTKLSI